MSQTTQMPKNSGLLAASWNRRFHPWTRRAVWIKGRYDLQFYDSLIVAAAEAGGCDEILTEDLNDGQIYCGVKAVNPFKGL
jgi:predicted nucleic acid-binding protein